MGIQGLLPLLKEASEPIHIRKYKGYTVGIDTYCWIHRGAVGCASQLAKGEPADHYVRYCLKYVNMLRSLGIKPVLVFDGRNLPAKASVEESRRERRETYSRKGKQFLREGKASEARDCFVKCINVTPEMALDVMKAVRSLDVDCIVAPYEADAQLAYLEKNGFVQAVITEDSDLVAFGCKKVIVKLDLAGNCLEIDSSNLNKSVKVGEKFTPDKFRYMCIVAGCDYLSSLPGIGIGKARKLFQLTSNPDIFQVIKRMATTLKMKTTVTPEYVEGFQQANNTFLYQLAFDPKKKKLQPLTPYPPELEPSMLTYAGKYSDPEKAYQMALGNLNFNSMVRMCDFDPGVTKLYDRTKTPRHTLSIWHQDYQPGPGLDSQDQAPEEHQGTKGREITVDMKQRIIQKKRQREDEEEEAPLSDAQLSAAYAHNGPVDGTQWMDECVVVLETPDKKESTETKPAKRNRFATKLLSKKKANILSNGEVVTSRFFPSKAEDTSAQNPVTIKKETEKREAEKENERDQLNTSGLLEGISSIEEEQDRQYKPENDSYLCNGDDDEELMEIKEERSSEARSKQTHVSKSMDALQRFQRSNSYPVLQKMDNKLSSSTISQQSKLSNTSTPLRSKSNIDISKDSQDSVAEIDSSQDSVISVKTNSSSQPSSSQRQGTPRPRSAFAWSRKEQLRGKTGKGRQSTLSTLSNFAFKPVNKASVMPRKSSILNSASDKGCPQGRTMTRMDSSESVGSLLSQNSLSQTTLQSSYSIPPSMDMEGIDEDNSRMVFIDSQSSSSQSQDTSSISLTISQSSHPASSSPNQDPCPSIPSSLAPPLPSLHVPPLPSLNPQARIGGGDSGETDGDRCKSDEEEQLKETTVSRGVRRSGLSRKRKSSWPSENQSVHVDDSSSPDTDLLSLNNSATSSQTSSSSPPYEKRGITMATSPNKHNPNTTSGLSSVQTKKKQKKNDKGFQKKSFQYFNDEQLQTTRGDEMELDEDKCEESENTPPRGGYIPASPSRKSSNMKLLGERNNQEMDEAAQRSNTPLPKKQSGLLGRCKTVGLSKKRRPSSKQTPTTTIKGQMSLLAFMPKQKPNLEATKKSGDSPPSPSRAAHLQDLTPELEGSLTSRHGNIITKRNIFDL